MSSQVSSDESYIQGCAFHDGFSPAIGVFGTAGLFVDDNVIHHTVGEGKTIRSLTLIDSHVQSTETGYWVVFVRVCRYQNLGQQHHPEEEPGDADAVARVIPEQRGTL